MMEPFEIFMRLEDSGWKGQNKTSIIQQPAKLRYYRELTSSYAEDGVLAVNLLKLGDEYIAAQVGVQIGKTLYLLKIAYNEAYSDISPGYLLIDGLISEQESDDFLEKISFVTGVGWIDRWKPSAEVVRVAYDGGSEIVNSLIKWGMSRQAAKAKNEAEAEA